MLDLFSARDAALKQVADNSGDYYSLALIELEEIKRSGMYAGQTFMAERIRTWLVPTLGKPHTDKLWGAITKGAINAELIEETGRWLHPTDIKSKGSRKPEYRWHD